MLIEPENSLADRRYRAGRYVRQTAGHRAFVPAPLPPDPPVALSGELLARLSEANIALAGWTVPFRRCPTRIFSCLCMSARKRFSPAKLRERRVPCRIC